MTGQSSFYPGFRRDLSALVASAILASCSEQRDGEASHMQFNYNPQNVGSSFADSVFDAPSFPSR